MKFKLILVTVAVAASVGLYLATHTIWKEDIEKMLDEFSEGLRSQEN